jgi:CheY-like chemotaxis protein
MPYRILVIDDNVQLRGVLKNYLQKFMNCDVILHPDGFSATKFMDEDKPELDAVILDVMMRSHGGSVARYMRNSPTYKDVLLVFYTGLERHQVDKKILGDAWFVHKSKGSLMEVISLLSKELKKTSKTTGSAVAAEIPQDVKPEVKKLTVDEKRKAAIEAGILQEVKPDVERLTVNEKWKAATVARSLQEVKSDVGSM